MASMNQVVLIGRVGTSPKEEIVYSQNGGTVLVIKLAINRPTKDEQGHYITDWIPCRFVNKQAEILAEYITKGDLLSVTGALQIDKIEVNGVVSMQALIRGENFQMLSSRTERAS